MVESIAVSGNDVYMAGFGDIYINDRHVSVAKYWKNGRSITLSDSVYDNYALSIAVSGNDVYVAGYQLIGPPLTGRSIAKYWKNGIPVILNDTLKNAAAYSIAVSGNEVYVAGSESTGGKDRSGLDSLVAQYWKNGNPVILSDAAPFTAAAAIVVSGGDVYVAGHVYSENKCWKNGNAISFRNNTYGSKINAMAVSGSDVYLAEEQSTGSGQFATAIAKYWKNDVAVSLTDGSRSAYANSIAVSGTDVYVAGYEYDRNYPTIIRPDQPLIWPPQSIARYWKNGSAVTLSDSTKENVVATSIFLSRE